MAQLKQIVRRLVFPKLWITALYAVAAAGLLVYTFVGGHNENWIAIPSYAFSSYAMALVCVRCWKIAKDGKKYISSAIDKVPLAQRYLEDAAFRIHVSLLGSLLFNTAYGILKLFSGFLYGSVWFGTLGIYYFLLAFMRFLLLHHASRKGFGTVRIGELRRYRLCGMILMVLNLSLTGVVILVIRKNEGFEYAGYLIYIMAMYAFYNVVNAVRNVVKYRKYKSPVMSAARVICLASALVSMLSLETAMLAQFGSEDSEAFRQIMSARTGAGVCAMILAMAIYMLFHATNELKSIRTEGME